MVPGNDPVIEAKDHVRDSEVVEAGPRQALEHRTPVIPDVAGKTALKRRQSWNGLRRLSREERSRDTQGVSRDGDPFPCGASPELRDFALTADYANRIGSEKGVVCIEVIWSGAVEKQNVWEIEEPVADLGWIFRMLEGLHQWGEAVQSPLRRSWTDAFVDSLTRLPADLRER
jgi:hypothetical protein